MCVSSRYDKVTPIQCIYPTGSRMIPDCIKYVFVLSVWTFNPTVLELHFELTKFWSSFSGIRINTVCILRHQIAYHNDECDNFSIIWRPSPVRMKTWQSNIFLEFHRFIRSETLRMVTFLSYLKPNMASGEHSNWRLTEIYKENYFSETTVWSLFQKPKTAIFSFMFPIIIVSLYAILFK